MYGIFHAIPLPYVIHIHADQIFLLLHLRSETGPKLTENICLVFCYRLEFSKIYEEDLFIYGISVECILGNFAFVFVLAHCEGYQTKMSAWSPCKEANWTMPFSN